MPDQATSLRRLARDSGALSPAIPSLRDLPYQGKSGAEPQGIMSPARRVREVGKQALVIAVASGKGGVGKSNVAVNLATQFTSAGKRVLVLDADLGLANADVLCGVEVPFNLSHVVARRKTVRDVVVRVPADRGGFELVGGASGLSRMADLDEGGRRVLLEALAEVERSADVVIVDTGAGISNNVLSFCRAADQVLVVTTPEPTAVTDAYALIKTLAGAGSESVGGKVSLLVNQVGSAAEGRAVYERIARVARQFLGVAVLDAGHVVSDEMVTRAVRKRVPLVLFAPESAASRCLAQLAARMEGSSGVGVAGGPVPAGKGGLAGGAVGTGGSSGVKGGVKGGLVGRAVGGAAGVVGGGVGRAKTGPDNGGGFFRRVALRLKGRG